MKDLVIVVCLYNKKIKEMKNYSSLNEDIYFFDNSTDQDIISENITDKKCVPMHGNRGLSYAYNCAIKKFMNEYQYIMLLDDDSKLEDEFFNILRKNFKLFPEVNIFLPKVINDKNGKVMYPKKMRDNLLLNILPFKTNKTLKSINSGTIIKLCDETLLYDEELFLYSTDFEYIKRVVNRQKYKCIESQLFQEFSIDDLNIENVSNRFALEIRDSKKYYSKFNFYTNYICLAIVYGIKIKSIKGMFLIFKEAVKG